MNALALLKTVFPFSFVEKKDVAALVINVLIYLVVGIVAGVLIGMLGSAIAMRRYLKV